MVSATAVTAGTPRSAPQIRIIYRDPAGRVHLDWPSDRLREALAEPSGQVWIDILDRKSDPAEVEALFRRVFGFHPLAIEDALQESSSPRLDDWGDYLYTVFHALDLNPDTDALQLNELDIFLGRNYLVSYHTEPIPFLDALRQNLGRDGGHRLGMGCDHLLYHILDLGVDAYMPAVEHLDDAIDAAQDEVFGNPTARTLHRIMRVKQSALRLHRILSPQREVLNRLARDEHALIDARDRVYFRDVYDHLVRLHDISETLRDLISGALDTYLSAISNRTNEVMKTLTIVTVLVLPLNFVVGFFGMNFFGDNIHLGGLQLPHALLFLVICTVMLVTPWGMWIWARWRGWF